MILRYLMHTYGILEFMEENTSGIQILSGFTFILGFLIVFRSQHAYARWWEGGTLLQQLRGEWFSSIASTMAFCAADPAKHEDVITFQQKLVRLSSLLYGAALSQVSEMGDKRFEFALLDGFDSEGLSVLQDCHDRCEVVMQWIQRMILEAHTSGVIDVPAPILARVYNQLGNGLVILNNARKLNDFPIPFPLAQMITVMMVLHSALTIVFFAPPI